MTAGPIGRPGADRSSWIPQSRPVAAGQNIPDAPGRSRRANPKTNAATIRPAITNTISGTNPSPTARGSRSRQQAPTIAAMTAVRSQRRPGITVRTSLTGLSLLPANKRPDHMRGNHAMFADRKIPAMKRETTPVSTYRSTFCAVGLRYARYPRIHSATAATTGRHTAMIDQAGTPCDPALFAAHISIAASPTSITGGNNQSETRMGVPAGNANSGFAVTSSSTCAHYCDQGVAWWPWAAHRETRICGFDG